MPRGPEIVKAHRWRYLIGWLTVTFSTALASMWAFWGIVENFHEGWYYRTAASNLGLMFAQYLSVTFILIVLALVAIRWPRFGGIFHALFSLGLIYLLRTSYVTALPLIAAPLTLLGLLWIQEEKGMHTNSCESPLSKSRSWRIT